jgi:hypothetical protein
VPYKTELEFLEPLSLKHLKNYQIWQHRQTIAGTLTSEPDDPLDYTHEARFMAEMLDKDAKNYHVWVYRHWLVEKLDLFGDERELAAVDELLEDDVRNNSAWSHRWLLVFGVPAGKAEDEEDVSYGAPGWRSDDGEDDDEDWVDEEEESGEPAAKDADNGAEPADKPAEKPKSAENPPRPASPGPRPSARAARAAMSSRATVAREAAYAMRRVRAAPQNESPWNYLRALHTVPPDGARLLPEKLRAFAEEFADLRAPEAAHPVALEERVPLRGSPWYGGVDLGPKPGVAAEAAERAEEEVGRRTPPVRSSHALDVLAMLLAKEEPEMAARALDLLASRYDPIRANYWNWRKAALVLPAKPAA